MIIDVHTHAAPYSAFPDMHGTDFPTGEKLNRAKPVYEYFDGWMCDISGCRTERELPKTALDYIKYIEKVVGCRIKYVSVGAAREQYIVMD
jgi:adenylosuccinate synthase